MELDGMDAGGRMGGGGEDGARSRCTALPAAAQCGNPGGPLYRVLGRALALRRGKQATSSSLFSSLKKKTLHPLLMVFTY